MYPRLSEVSSRLYKGMTRLMEVRAVRKLEKAIQVQSQTALNGMDRRMIMMYPHTLA